MVIGKKNMNPYTHEELNSFFNPKHIAVIGATPNNQWFGNIFANAMESRFAGQLYPVNPKLDDLYGFKVYKSIEDLPESVIDFAVLIIRSDLVLKTVMELEKKGITHVLVISSGFSELGGEGKQMQEELRDYCNEHHIMIMGPNCLGFINLAENVSVFSGRAVEGKFKAGPVGVVGQSGATTELITTKILAKTPGVSLYVSTGNEAQLRVEDCLEYFVNDEHTTVIAGFVEQFRDIEKLKSVAAKALDKQIPIIILKVGKSEKGQKAAQSHTGALAGNDKILQGYCSQMGIIRVDTVEELVDTASLFSQCELPAGPGLGICTFSGGLCGVYADLCEAEGIMLPHLSAKTMSRLKELLPAFAIPGNPLDVTGSGFLSGMREIIEAMLEDDNIDIVAPICIPPQNSEDRFANMINNSFLPLMHGENKPITPIVFKEISEYAREYFRKQGFYYLENPLYGFKALSHFIWYAFFLRKRGYMN